MYWRPSQLRVFHRTLAPHQGISADPGLTIAALIAFAQGNADEWRVFLLDPASYGFWQERDCYDARQIAEHRKV